jgi:hypothetical protein
MEKILNFLPIRRVNLMKISERLGSFDFQIDAFPHSSRFHAGIIGFNAPATADADILRTFIKRFRLRVDLT